MSIPLDPKATEPMARVFFERRARAAEIAVPLTLKAGVSGVGEKFTAYVESLPDHPNVVAVAGSRGGAGGNNHTSNTPQEKRIRKCQSGQGGIWLLR